MGKLSAFFFLFNIVINSVSLGFGLFVWQNKTFDDLEKLQWAFVPYVFKKLYRVNKITNKSIDYENNCLLKVSLSKTAHTIIENFIHIAHTWYLLYFSSALLTERLRQKMLLVCFVPS